MKRIAIGVTLIVSILGLASADAQAPGKWVKLAPFPEPSEELYGAAAGGKFSVFGGLAPGRDPTAAASALDPAGHPALKQEPLPLAPPQLVFTARGGRLSGFGALVPPAARPS